MLLSGASSDDCARGGDTSSNRSLRPCHVHAPMRTASEDSPGRGGGTRCSTRRSSGTTHTPRSPTRGDTTSTLTTACRSSVAPGQTGWHPCLVHKSGFSGTSWSRSSTLCLGCGFSMLPCRRGNSWRMSSALRHDGA